MIGIETLDIRLQIRNTHAGGTLHMHQRQTAAGDEALKSAQRDTQLLGGFAPDYQRSADPVEVRTRPVTGQALA